MLTVRGVNLYPSNVEHLLLSVPEVAPHYQLVVDRLGAMDEVTVHCEPLSPEVDAEVLRTTVETVLREHTGIRITVELLEPGAVPRSEGKAVRVVDGARARRKSGAPRRSAPSDGFRPRRICAAPCPGRRAGAAR